MSQKLIDRLYVLTGGLVPDVLVDKGSHTKDTVPVSVEDLNSSMTEN